MQEGSNEARAQAGNYQQDNGPDAQNNYILSTSPGAETSNQQAKNYKTKDLRFGNQASNHMDDPGRSVPIQVLQEAIETGTAMPDPRGSDAVMYYMVIHKNGKKYNLEVLYDTKTNTIYHFMYTKEPIGNLPPIK